MPATPAWPPQSTPRLFVAGPLAVGLRTIDGAQAHYLAGVMRIRPGDPVKLFDGDNGEWLAIAREVGRKTLVVELTQQLRTTEAVPDLWLCAAPLKKGRIDWLAEKACELGVAQLVPVITARTIVDRLNGERLYAHMVEAAEQCGRTAVPALAEPVKLAALLRDWGDRHLFFADETGGAPAAATMAARPGPAAILIGPEGGFTPEEREAIRRVPQAVGIGLGPRILRADTAAAAAVALWMASAGDWRL
ncbi:MAG: 16S rRNA (uracil(1498)-N(3))-methyltransferase [Sphingomonas sp.]|nr:16S rRNA (uracil(1498)-N(3))-methyltransferase [Sphingomonas sp.]